MSPDELVQAPLFAGVDREAIAQILALGRAVQFTAGEEIFARGGVARELLIVESGAVDLFFPLSVLGVTKDVTIERIGPGDVLGWSALIPPHSLTLSARAAEACEARALAREALGGYLAEHADVGRLVTQNVAGVVGRRLHHFQDLWIREIQARVVDLLG